MKGDELVKVFEINGGVFGSTGKIMFGIASESRKQGIEVRCASPITSTNKDRQPNEEYYKIGDYLSRRINVLLAKVTGFNGCFAYFSTRKLLKEMDDFTPDIVHLHTLHNSYINLPLLFNYLSKKKIKVVWTLHDCWAFTGQCPHFVVEKCSKWEHGCYGCPKYKEYPATIFDNTKIMWKLKKKWFTQINDMTIVTPSYWLHDLVGKSFLNNKKSIVIHNGIDLSIFKPIKSDIFNAYKDKYIVLGVAFGWNYRKGLDVFEQLAIDLPSNYQIVLVGTDEEIESKISKNIVCIRRTQNQNELAKIYSAATVFVNPTREDTFPTVNIESLACGTPVVTFKTGGSPEIINEKCGIVVENESIGEMKNAIETICKGNSKEIHAIERAKKFNMIDRFKEYTSLFLDIKQY